MASSLMAFMRYTSCKVKSNFLLKKSSSIRFLACFSGDKYRAINYSNVCDEPMRDAKRIPGENSVSSDLHIDGSLIDSITWVEIEQTLYVFSGHKFYRITLDIERSGVSRSFI